MSRPVKNARTRTSPGGPKIPEVSKKVGMPAKHSGRENPGAGEITDAGTPMWKGPSQILRDNRRG